MSFYLIDFENVGEAGFNGIENLQKEDTVIVFYSKKSCKISMDIFGRNRNNAEMKFIKTDVGTKNALDFQLVSYLGFLAKSTTDKEQFCIISQDNGYSPLVSFWKRYDVPVKLAVDLAGNTVPVAETKKKVKAEKKASDSELQKEKQKAEIENAVSKVLKKKEESKIEKVVKIVISSKTKNELNANLINYLRDGKKVSEVIKSVKPFVKLK